MEATLKPEELHRLQALLQGITQGFSSSSHLVGVCSTPGERSSQVLQALASSYGGVNSYSVPNRLAHLRTLLSKRFVSLINRFEKYPQNATLGQVLSFREWGKGGEETLGNLLLNLLQDTIPLQGLQQLEALLQTYSDSSFFLCVELSSTKGITLRDEIEHWEKLGFSKFILGEEIVLGLDLLEDPSPATNSPLLVILEHFPAGTSFASRISCAFQFLDAEAPATIVLAKDNPDALTTIARLRYTALGDGSSAPLALSSRKLHQELTASEALELLRKDRGPISQSAFFCCLVFLVELGLGGMKLGAKLGHFSTGEIHKLYLALARASRIPPIAYFIDLTNWNIHPTDSALLAPFLTSWSQEEDLLLCASENLPFFCQTGLSPVKDSPLLRPEEGCLGSVGVPDVSLGKKWPRTSSLSSKEIIISRYSLNERSFPQDFSLPLEKWTVLRGPSGRGKSVFLSRFLLPRLKQRTFPPEPTGELVLEEYPKALYFLASRDHYRLRSAVGNCSGLFAILRKLYAQMPQSRMQGLLARDFSRRSKKGRCPKCHGRGRLLHNDRLVMCTECSSYGYAPLLQGISYRRLPWPSLDKLTIAEALAVFSRIPAARRILQVMTATGLGQLTLGASTSVLTASEFQRWRLVPLLLPQSLRLPASTGNEHQGSFLILDELSTGCTQSEVQELCLLLAKALDKGLTIISADSHPLIWEHADWVIDL